MIERPDAISSQRKLRRSQLGKIFRAALKRVDPYQAILRHVQLKEDQLLVTTEHQTISVNLKDYDNILLLGAGKATAPMARAFEELLGERISTGFVCVKEGHGESLKRVQLVEASHPIPDERGLVAAQRIIDLATAADERTLVINCISGGASALLPCPINRQSSDGLVQVSLDDKQATTRELLNCSASIGEINCIRKHLSALKGGQLLQYIAPAHSLNFILSDVVGDDLSSIASGLTSADLTTFADALTIIDDYQIRQRLPNSVVHALELGLKGELIDTVKPGDMALKRTNNIIIGSNRQALMAAAEQAQELGYHTRSITAQLEGEARHVARTLGDVARDVAQSDMLVEKPACLLFGGETVVRVTGKGKGGRNQEMALAFLKQLNTWPTEQQQAVSFLSAATDGNDGPTDAAGAFADAELLQISSTVGLDLESYLADNDSYHFFKAISGLLKTGPTNTNVCDIQIILIH